MKNIILKTVVMKPKIPRNIIWEILVAYIWKLLLRKHFE